MFVSFDQVEYQVLDIQFAHHHATIAADRATVGAITVQVLPLIEYLYIVTALLPIRYKKSSFASIANTDVPSGVVVHVGTVRVVAVLLDIVLICHIPVPDMIRT